MVGIGEKLAIFQDRFPLVGPVIWILTIQYFIAQLSAAAAWPVAYLWSVNTISDLGNTACGQLYGRFVCSPDHALMNSSFIWLGLFMTLGSLFIYQEFRESRASLFGFTLMALAGLGTLIVGLNPENVTPWLHNMGAFAAFAFGNLSLIVLTFALWRVHVTFRIYTFLSGLVSLIALGLYASHIYLGLGQGGMERLVSYPQTIWLILFGIYMTHSHYRSFRRKKILEAPH